MSGRTVKLTFEGLLPKDAIYSYYASNYDGYLGFNFQDLGLITEAGIDHAHLDDTGFGSVLRGDAEAFTAFIRAYEYAGEIYSLYNGETFNLRSGIFASYRGTQQAEVACTDANGHGKGYVKVNLSEAATTIDFANYGRSFKDISRVYIFSTYHSIVMDNIKVHWNGPIPGSGAMKHHVHVSHPVLAVMGHQNQTGNAISGDHRSDTGAGGHCDPGYHGELTSLASSSHHGGGLTSEFSLPQADHFGT